MSVSEQDVERVAELANLELTSGEKARMLRDLNSVLDYFAQLNELDTSSVPPMAQVADQLTVGSEPAQMHTPASGRNCAVFEPGPGDGLCSGYGRSLLQGAQSHRALASGTFLHQVHVPPIGHHGNHYALSWFCFAHPLH